jgi:hypothetical protein
MKRLRKGVTELDLLRDLMLGGRHSRQTAVRLGISFPTADRWLESLMTVPGVRRIRPEYERAGRAAYEGFFTAKGVHDETPWEKLVWGEKYAWCEAARAARATT